MLGPGEWWLPDLARAVGLRLGMVRAWGKKGWLRARKSPVQGLWIAWADEPEMDRLRRLGAILPGEPFRPLSAGADHTRRTTLSGDT